MQGMCWLKQTLGEHRAASETAPPLGDPFKRRQGRGTEDIMLARPVRTTGEPWCQLASLRLQLTSSIFFLTLVIHRFGFPHESTGNNSKNYYLWNVFYVLGTVLEAL